jgi:hypothetical protein
MAVSDERAQFNRVKQEILASIESMRKVLPEAAEYLEKHLVIDEEAMTITYTGDDRLKLKRIE